MSAPPATAVRVFETPLGRIGVVATARGLARVMLPNQVARCLPVTGTATRCAEGSRPCRPRLNAGAAGRRAAAHAARAEREIRAYLAGRRRTFGVPLDLAGVPSFRRKVLRAARRIPYGATATYADLAWRAGNPRAARAAGQAMAHNPLALVVPCHRVVASGGGLGGFGGGLALKRRLLALEAGRRRGGR